MVALQLRESRKAKASWGRKTLAGKMLHGAFWAGVVGMLTGWASVYPVEVFAQECDYPLHAFSALVLGADAAAISLIACGLGALLGDRARRRRDERSSETCGTQGDK